MTCLQRKKRCGMAHKLLTPGKITSAIASAKSGRSPFISTKRAKPYIQDVQIIRNVRVDQSTEQAMRDEVESLLKRKGGSCSLKQLADVLSGSSEVLHRYAKQGSNIFLDIGQSIAKVLGKKKHQNLARRYQIINAFSKFTEETDYADTTPIDSWDRAKEIFSSTFIFPKEEKRDGLVVSEFKNLTLVPSLREEQFSVEDSSISKWRSISMAPLPERINRLDGARELGPLEKDIAARQAKHEEAKKSKIVEKVERQMAEREREKEAKKLASSLLREFTPEEEAIVTEAMYGIGPESEIMYTLGPDSVQRGSMHRLQPGEWLNDEVIHFFLVMLALRDEEICRQNPNKKRSHFFKSFFMTKLMNEGHTDPSKADTYEYKNVKRWSKKVPGKDIFNLDKIIFPINQGRMHWVCAVAYMQEKKIQFFDSMGQGGMEDLENIFRYIQDEHKDKKKCPLPNIDQWELIPCTRDTPRQRNGFDCGVFTCMFADFISKDCPLLFNQEHITECRKRMALSICQGKAII